MAESISKGLSSAEAVMLGVLASGINGPTWIVLKATFMMLAVCLFAMLSLAFVSREFVIIGHVVLLVIIAGVLFMLLNSFVAHAGLVSVEQQIGEMGMLRNHGRHSEDKRQRPDEPHTTDGRTSTKKRNHAIRRTDDEPFFRRTDNSGRLC